MMALIPFHPFLRVFHLSFASISSSFHGERAFSGYSDLGHPCPMLNRLVEEVQRLYDERTEYYEQWLSASELHDLKISLQRGTFSFSPMRRSFIPKANKPGQFRPITEPAGRDRIVMQGLSHLLSVLYEPEFSPSSHGFRPKRGLLTFFAALSKCGYGKVERVIKADIVKCFDNIDHNILLSLLRKKVGEENDAILRLVQSFLGCKIFDKGGKDYSNQKRGIPQGSPLSPLLMNVFLHQLDIRVGALVKEVGSIEYLRYADDMLVVIKSGSDSSYLHRRFTQVFNQALRELKLTATSSSILRGKPGKLRVLGLLLLIGPDGRLQTKAPFARWKRKLNPQYLLAKVKGQPDQERKPELGDLLEASLNLVKTYSAFNACSPFPARGQREELIRFFKRTIALSSKHFLRDFHQKEGKREYRQVRDVLASVSPIVNSLQRRMKEKSEEFLTEEAERERKAFLEGQTLYESESEGEPDDQ